jgi:hypothetical protein
MEPIVQSTEDKTKFLEEQVEVGLDDLSYTIDIYDTPLGRRWLAALADNLTNKRILEKNFCFLGFAGSKRDLNYLVRELNGNIAQINSFTFDPPYEKIHPFAADDFQYSSKLPMGLCPDGDDMSKPGLRLKHESCNLLHRYFEDLQGTAWKLSECYKQADFNTKYAIRQLNNLCHEIESWVQSYRKSVVDPDWIRPAQITTFLNAPRYHLHDEDFDQFLSNRYRRELGGVYLHWSQVGKTLYEVFRDEDGSKLDEATCSAINHQRYYSGEFDVEWGRTIDEDTFAFKKQEMEEFRAWLELNGFDWKNPKLALGYAKIGQVDLNKSFGDDHNFKKIYDTMVRNLNIKNIKIVSSGVIQCDYPYSLDSDDWRQIQMEGLKDGYKSRSVR